MEYMKFTMTNQSGKYDGQRVLLVRGMLTRTTFPEFQDAVRAEKARVLIVDLSGVPYVDSDGLGAIINAHISYVKAGRRFALAAIPDRLRNLLKMTGVEHVFTIFSTSEEAQEILGK